MLTLYIYTLDRYKKKAMDLSNNKILKAESDSDFRDLFSKLEEVMCCGYSYTYAINTLKAVEALEKFSELSAKFNPEKIKIFLDSRITFGSKWGKYSKIDKETFNTAISFVKEGFPENEKTRKK